MGGSSHQGTIRVLIQDGRLDPVRPASLKRHIRSAGWEELVETLEDLFQPALTHNRQAMCVHAGFIVVTLFLVIGLWAGLWDINDGFSDQPDLAIAYFIFGCYFLYLIKYHINGYCYIAPKVEHDVDDFIVEFSNTNKGGLTLQLIQEGSDLMQDMLQEQVGDDGQPSEQAFQSQGNLLTVDYILQIQVDEERGGYQLTNSNGQLDDHHHHNHRHHHRRDNNDKTSSRHDQNDHNPNTHSDGISDEQAYYQNNYNDETEDDEDDIRVKKRLKRLERAKKYLTKNEYDGKRKAILDEI